MLNSLIKYAKGQGEKGVNNLQKIKDYLGEENNAFLEMQILNKLFKESVVENDRASLRVFDSESFLGRVRELVGDTPAPLGANLEARALSGASQGPSKQENFIKKALNKDEAKLFLENLNGAKIPKKLDIEGFLKELESVENKENFISHLSKKEDAQSRLAYLNLVEPTLKEADLILRNGKRQDYIKKFNDGKDFFTLLITEENGKRLITFLPKTREDFIKNKIDNASLIQSFTSRASKQGNGLANESITQPLFKSKEAREFLELVEGFHKLYKNDASIAKNLVQGTSEKLSTSIATSAEGAIKQKVVKGAFDPIFRLLPDKILFGLFAKQIQGGALRYHLKKALSRSLNYDDFKIKLEKELKRTNFNSNTSRLIDEFMQNLEDFNREKEQFLEAKRAEEARIKEEERKRAEEIYQAQEANNLKDILEAEEKPLKDEFGVNFEGFKGKEAIEKLLEEQRGQVKGAFYKEGLGEIDLVWGDENFGLRHILEQRTKQWGEEKALKFISHLNENIEKGQIVEVQKGRAAIKTDLTTIILDKKENNNFVLTAFRDRNNKKELESLNLSQSKTFTSENAEANAKESPVTSLNQESIIAQKAKNDEVLEAEVIEEVGLNEPMKFLEFQQRKLLTYIKENTPLRLLEHKKELKTRDILNFLEQSALNGKQKVFLMRNLERDFTKLKEDFKELESQSFKRDLLDKTKPLRKAEKEELTSEVLEQVQKENLKLYLNDTSGNLTKFLNAKKPFKITMRGANIKHILNRHGENSTLAKNGQPFVNLEDIKKYDEIINNADRQILKENDKGEKTLLSGKQINGHYIVISSVRLKNGELKLKTMYKENGKLENDKAFKSVKLPSETPSVLRGQSLTTDLDGYPSHADESIAQNSQEAKIKEAVKNHNAIYKEILDNDYIFTDERSKIFRKRERELIENLAKDEKVQAFTSQWGYPFKKDGELHGVGLDYKAKVYGKGEHKMMRVSGGGFGSATQQKKQERLLELEKERLQEAFKADFGIDGFISKYVENGFFETLWRETSAYKGTDYGWGVQPREYYPYYENRIMPSDTITQAKEKLQKEKSSWSVKRQETKGSEDIIFTDKKGKEHTLTKETQKAWLEAFGLKSLEDSYIPNHNEAIKQALEGKEIKLQLGSLKKLVAQGREKYIPQIKEVLDRPEAIMRDDMGEYLFIKHLKDDDYFVNVSFDNGEYLVSISNGIKETRNLNNKLKKGGEFIYQSPNFNFISQKLLQTSQYSANKIDEDIIAQNAKSESEKEVLERQIPFIEAEIQKYEAKIASLDERIKKTQTRIQPYLDEINALQKQYDELYFTETRGEEANAKKWLKLEEIKAKQEELRKPYNDALFKFVFPHQRLKGKVQTEIQKLKFGLQDRALRLEEIQNEALNTSKAQKAWLEAFGLKSLEEAYIPNFKAEVKEAINRVLGGEEIKLTKGSFEKLLKRDREEFLPYIKDTLEKADLIIKDKENALIFVKDIGKKSYFTSVAKNASNEWVISTNSLKTLNTLKNRVDDNGEVLYLSKEAPNILAEAFTKRAFSNELAKDIIAQNSEKLPFETQTLDEDKLSGDEVRHLANKIGEKSTMAYFKDYLLKMDKNFHARAKDIIREYYKIEPFRKELENQWENVKAAYKNGEMSLKEFKFLSKYKDEKGFLNQVAGVLWLQNDELVKNRGYTINKYGLTEQGKGDNYYQNLALEYGKAQTALKKWFYYIQKANKQAQRFFNKKELEDLRANEKAQKLETKGSEDIIFTDKKGKEHTLTKETQKAWLEAFGLKSLDEEAIVEIPADLKERLGKEIKLNKKDFEKLMKNKREKYIPQIKETFKEPEAVFIDENDDLIFTKTFNDKLFFVNVNRDYGEAFKALSLAPKKNNNLLNKLNKAKEILKLDSKLRDYTAQQAFTGVLSASNKSSSESIAQKPQQKSLNLQEIEQALKARISQINDEISANDKAFKENLKEVSKVKPILEALKKEWEALEPAIITWTHTDYSKAKPKKYYKRKPNLSNLWHIEETLDVYKGYARESDRHANQVAREIALLEKYVKLLKDKEAEVKAFKAKAEADENALILESRIIPIYNQLREAFKKGHHTTKQILEANNIKQDSVQAKEVIDSIAQTRQYLEDTFNIKPLEEFGTNYAEFYRDGKGAVEKLLKEAEDFKQRGEKGEFKGQVAGAFYKEGLGEIDLVWGDSKKGLSHILERRTQDFINQGLEKGKAEYKVRELLSEIPQILENGKILSQNNDKIELITDKYTLVLGLREDKKFIVTELIDKRNKKRLEAMQTGVGDSFTDEPLAKTPLSQNQQEIIPQQKIKFAMEKFNYDEKKAKDLLEWHKNSHALTKDENGLPKVFYHGTYSKFRVFRRVGKASQQGFFFTPSQKATEEYGDITLNTFLNIKNPFRADELKINKEADLQKWADILKLDYDKEKYESFKDLKTKLEKVKEATKKAGFKFHSASGGGVYVIDNKGRNSFINLEELDKENKRVVEAFKGLETEDIYFYYVVRNEFDLVLYALNKNDRYFHTSGRDEVKRVLEKLGYDGVVLNDTIITVFNSNQIKHIDNKGSFTDTKGNVTSKKPKDKEAEFSYFNEKSDNIYHSNPHLGAGLVGGVLNGVEQDENGNLSFDPVKFAMGFLGGAAGSKAVKESIKWRANKVKKAYPNIAKNNPALMEQIAKRDLLTYAKNETQNALTRLLNKNKLFDSTKGLFAGEKALLNEAYAPHKARLEKAKELEGSGADEIEIWEKTGWYKDKDNKWKFEISQRGGELKLKYTPKNKAVDWLVYSIGVEKNLADFLDDKELFKAYPQLKDIKIKTFTYQESADSPFVVGRYEQDKKEIKLNAENIDTDMEKAKSFLYHEIQHAIQDIEGFAYGEHLSMYSKDNYRLRHGEVEARNVQKRLRGAGKPYTKEDAKRGLEILNASIKRIEQGIQNVKNGVGEYKDETQETKDFILQNYDSDLREALEDKEYVLHFINDEIYNRTPHPHKTMDTPLKDTIAESTIQGEVLSKELEKGFLDESGRVDYKSLMQNAEKLPKELNLRGFKQMIFNNDKTKQLNAENALIKTPVGEVKVNVLRAFNHYFKQAPQGNKKENRQALNATFMPTLLEPKFVTRDEAGTMYYYKPFISKDKQYHITSIAVKKNGNLDYATSYNATENRLRQMIKHNELVYMEEGLS
ncbi:hypothetical protein D6H77_02555 [Campylobacter upsaliensis]|nr:hypothetical protein [Campylobacter upsaliensis]